MGILKRFSNGVWVPVPARTSLGTPRFHDGATWTELFDPRTLPMLEGWWDARWINGFPNAQPTDGTTVAQWNDLSGLGRHLVQATATGRPIFRATAFNGGPTVTYDGVDDAMATATNLTMSGGNFTYYLAYQMRGTIANERLISAKAGGPRMIIHSSGSDLTALAVTLTGGASTRPATSGVNHIAVARFSDGTTSQVFVDGVGSTPNPAAGSANFTNTTLNIGGFVSAATFFPPKADITAVLFFSTAHDDATRIKVQQWMSRVTGVPVA